MELFAVLLLLIILVVLLVFKGDVSSRLKTLEAETRRLRDALSEAQLKGPASQDKTIEATKAESVVKPRTAEKQHWETGFQVAEKQLQPEELQEQRIQEWLQEKKPAGTIETPELVTTSSAPITPTIEPTRHKPTFWDRNPDLEKFIGENLISKIGIGILVLAIAYFVKFAIDQNWIGTIGRVAIGLVCGGILVGLAHKLRHNYKAFSSVLVGGGIAVFYFTIALAYHQFHLFGQTTAFVIMLVITIFAVVLSLWYDRQELAIIALVGGFAAPFMVSDGSGNYKTLFIYLILLNTGLLVIAYNKAWRLLNLLAFVFTITLVGGWIISLDIDEPASTYRNGFLFATIFYLLFFAINIAHNIRENKKFIASDFGILLANTSLYFAAGLTCLYFMKATEYKGLFSAAMGVLNLVVSYTLFRNRKVDTNILYLLIGITLTFVSLTAPLQLEGNYITLFWASESALLYWLYQKSQIGIIKATSLLVWIGMLGSLFMDWINVYTYAIPLPIIINKGFTTTVYSAFACYCLYRLKRVETAPEKSKGWRSVSTNLFYSASGILLFIAGTLEVGSQFHTHYPGMNIYALYLQLYTFLFVMVFLLLKGAAPYGELRAKVEAGLLIICILFYLIQIPAYYDEQSRALEVGRGIEHFSIAHWVTALLTIVIIARLISIYRTNNKNAAQNGLIGTWSLCIVIIVFVSVEMNLLIRALFYSNTNPLPEIQRVYNKTVLPILWGLSSFGFMWLGMKHKFRTLRIVSLSLFSLTLLKLFMFDIQNIPIAGKIAAFFCLGVLLLVVSFMYQRLKKIIIEDEQKPVV